MDRMTEAWHGGACSQFVTQYCCRRRVILFNTRTSGRKIARRRECRLFETFSSLQELGVPYTLTTLGFSARFRATVRKMGKRGGRGRRRVTVLPREYGYLGLVTLRFDNWEYLRSRSFRILEPRDSVLSLLDLVVFTTYHCATYMWYTYTYT